MPRTRRRVRTKRLRRPTRRRHRGGTATNKTCNDKLAKANKAVLEAKAAEWQTLGDWVSSAERLARDIIGECLLALSPAEHATYIAQMDEYAKHNNAELPPDHAINQRCVERLSSKMKSFYRLALADRKFATDRRAQLKSEIVAGLERNMG